jgi:hypothetical protein
VSLLVVDLGVESADGRGAAQASRCPETSFLACGKSLNFGKRMRCDQYNETAVKRSKTEERGESDRGGREETLAECRTLSKLPRSLLINRIRTRPGKIY